MLHSLAGDRVDAARLARNTPVHQLNAKLALRFEHQGGRTRLHVDRQDPPWKVVRAFSLDGGGVLVHLHNVSGGVLAGDRLSLDIQAAPGAIAQVTTTGATRLYRHRAGAEDSEQHVNIRVSEGAMVEYLPDPLIPFAGSRHTQRTTISLASGATFFSWDTLAPGRQASGELFKFERLRIETDVRAGAIPVLRESFVLEPLVRPLSVTARMGAYTHLASFFACRQGESPAFWREIENELNQIAHQDNAVWGASALGAGGVLARGLTASSRGVPTMLAKLWNVVRRKLTGSEGTLPRKVY